MNASVAIQVLPGVQGEEVIRIVDEVIAYIKSSGLNTYVGPFETTIEGDYDQLMEIVKECQLICIRLIVDFDIGHHTRRGFSCSCCCGRRCAPLAWWQITCCLPPGRFANRLLSRFPS